MNHFTKASYRANMTHVQSVVTCLAVLGVVNGCSIETVHTYVQSGDGLGMKAPITFTVRLRVDTANKIVTWMQDSEDARGVTDRQIRTYGGFLGSTCDVFDQRNWSCEIRGADGKVLERREMKDGALSRFYWIDTQRYRTRRRMFGYVF